MIKKTLHHAIEVLAILRDYPQARLEDIATDLGRGLATIKRDIRLLRSLGCEIRWDARSYEYMVTDFGVFNKDRLVNPLDTPPSEKRPFLSSEELRAIRASSGLSRREFAARIGRGHCSLRNWEQGYTTVPVDAIPAIRSLDKRSSEENSSSA